MGSRREETITEPIYLLISTFYIFMIDGSLHTVISFGTGNTLVLSIIRLFIVFLITFSTIFCLIRFLMKLKSLALIKRKILKF